MFTSSDMTNRILFPIINNYSVRLDLFKMYTIDEDPNIFDKIILNFIGIVKRKKSRPQ